jgi:hypothetical protein
MAGFRSFASMALSDDEQYDWLRARQLGGDQAPPEYPSGMSFMVREDLFEQLDVDDPRPGDTISFAAMAQCTSVNRTMDGCRMECEIIILKLGDSDFVELPEMCRPCICLDENDHERLDLDEDSAERGHLIHMIGSVRVESTNDTAFGGCVMLQVIEAACEDESQETEEDM